MAQLIFPFSVSDSKKPYRAEDFLFLPENSVARNLLEKFFLQKEFGKSLLSSLILRGPRQCGKTHLLHIFSEKFGAEFLDHKKISQLNLVEFFAENRFYILDDVEDIEDEELLLRLVNSAFEAKAFLILILNDITQFRLKDLLSRLKNIPIAEIKNPDLDAVKQLVVNALAARQIKLSMQLIDFISSRVARNYTAIFGTIKKLEDFANERGKNISLKDVKELLV